MEECAKAEKLEKELQNARDAQRNAEIGLAEYAARNEELQAENERLKTLFEQLDTWSKAYPLKVFPKPDLKKAHEVLKASGMTLDAISADAMRHVLEGIKNIVEQALKGD